GLLDREHVLGEGQGQARGARDRPAARQRALQLPEAEARLECPPMRQADLAARARHEALDVHPPWSVQVGQLGGAGPWCRSRPERREGDRQVESRDVPDSLSPYARVVRTSVDYDNRQHAVYDAGRSLSGERAEVSARTLARHIAAGSEVLDLGCGTGVYSELLANRLDAR